MKIGINAFLLHDASIRGWNRYTTRLMHGLTKKGVTLVLYSERPIHSSHLVGLPAGSYELRVAQSRRRAVYFDYWLPRQCQRDKVDLLHCPINFGLPFFSPCPTVLTLHDAIGFDKKKSGLQSLQLRPSEIQNNYWNWSSRTRATRIITVSNHAKSDLVTLLKIPENKIEVIYEAADERFSQPVTEEKKQQVLQRHGIMKPYVFYIGGWEGRKNIPFLVRAFAEASVPGTELVLAGGKATERDALAALAQSLGIENRLRLLTWIEDDELPVLYAAAECFVYPSNYEGFGLQLCEAMAAGCPSLAANATSLPEVLGDGGELFPIDQTERLSLLLRRVLTDATFANQLRQRAILRSQAYSWDRTAVQTIELYDRVLRPNATTPEVVAK